MTELVTSLLERLAEERRALLRVVAAIPAADFWLDAGQWSPGDALAHIEPMEAWLMTPIELCRDELPHMDAEQRDHLTARYRGMPVAAVVSALARRRERTEAALRGCRDLDAQVSTQWGPLTRTQLVRMVYRHDAEHRVQIQELVS